MAKILYTMRKVKVEICAYSIESCHEALNAEADRIELCASPFEGGVTPSPGTIQEALNIEGIEKYVMIRPRGGDFLYSKEEFNVMKKDILYLRELKCDGVVFGILDRNGNIDINRTTELVELAYPLKVTFHRAFDMSQDIYKSLEDVIRCGCNRILTSGGRNTVNDGIDNIKRLVYIADNRIEIMAGSGVNINNYINLLTAGVNAIHLSGKNTRDSEMVFRNPIVSMGGVPNIPEYDIMYSDKNIIRPIVNGVREFMKSNLRR